MPLGDFERTVLHLLSVNRNPQSFVAGATVFLRRQDSLRQSMDIDLFHDTENGLERSAELDARTLDQNGYSAHWVEKLAAMKAATVSKAGRSTKIEWVCDSPFRFFPAQADGELGFVLHSLDAATNKLLALAGRGEIRDYLDVLYLHGNVLSLGALAWAACGKDSGFTPQFLIQEAQRLAHYPASRLNSLILREPMDLVECKRRWLKAVEEADALFDRVPPEEIGCLYLDSNGNAVTPNPSSKEFPRLYRHFGSVGGAMPGTGLNDSAPKDLDR